MKINKSTSKKEDLHANTDNLELCEVLGHEWLENGEEVATYEEVYLPPLESLVHSN